MAKKHMCKSIKLMSVICTIVLISQIFTILTFGANGIQPGVNDQEIISDHVYHIKVEGMTILRGWVKQLLRCAKPGKVHL